jgi:hypothetical protein
MDSPSSPGLTYTVSGGTPPYKVATLLNNNIDFSITKIDGFASVQTYTLPSSFTVTNTLTCGSDTTVIVAAQDDAGARTFSIYYINCP